MHITTSNLAETLLRHGIGFDRLWPAGEQPQTGFPPHNIEQIDDNRYLLTLAIAGYAPDSIAVSLEDGHLLIAADGPEDKPTTSTYLHRGIALRDFKRSFKLGPNIEVTEAEMVNGLLSISLERIIPDHQKPKLIPINYR